MSGEVMGFPKSVEEFMEEYKVVDTEHVYTNGTELVPIFRMEQWFEHIGAEPIRHGKWIKVGDNTYRCSRCNEVSCCNGNFCTDCGAKMDENEISNIARESADKISKALEKVRAKGMQKQNIKEDDKP